MKIPEYITFWLVILALTITSFVFGIKEISSAIRDYQPTNVSEYLIRQDEKIESLEGDIVTLFQQVDNAERWLDDEEIYSAILYEYLTEAEASEAWKHYLEETN